MRARYLHLCDALIIIEGSVVKLLMAAMTIDVLLGVFFRYVIGDALTWTEEAGRYLMIWMGYLAAAIALREGNHVAVDVLLQALPGRAKDITVVSRLLSLLFLLTVIALGIVLLPRLRSRSAALGINIFWPYLAVPVGCFLTALEMIALMWRDVKPHAEGRAAVAAETGEWSKPC